MPHAPVITPYVDESPCPRVEVFFASFTAGTATVTVYRLAAGREYVVRGAVRAATGGTLTRIDFEVPFNVPVTYRAEMFDDDGVSLGFTDSTEVTVVSVFTWLHNPLDPAGAVHVRALAGTAAEIDRPVPATFSRPLGRRVAVALAEPRLGVSGLAYSVFAPDMAAADKVQDLLGSYTRTAVPVICIRIGMEEEPMRIPRPMFLGTAGIIERDIGVNQGLGFTRHDMVGDESDPPVPGLFIPLLTAADLNAYYDTAADLNSGNLTGAAVNRRYDLAGYATA